MLTSKKIIIKVMLLLIVTLNIFSICSFAVVSPTSDFYVNDYAGLLSVDTKNYIVSINKNLYSKTGAQIVVVTIPTLGNDSLEEYATELFRKFGIGDKNKNNGVLILLALQERELRIEVGYGLEGALTDGKTGRIQDEYIIPYLRQDNWDDGIKNGFNAILDVVAEEYQVEVDGAQVPVNNNSEVINSWFMFSLLHAPFISIIIGVIIELLYNGKKVKKKGKIALCIIYMLIIIGIISMLLKQLFLISISAIFNLLALLYGLSFSSGRAHYGGRWLLWGRPFWWILRRFIRRRTEALAEVEVLAEVEAQEDFNIFKKKIIK